MPDAPAVLTVHAVDHWGDEGVVADALVLRELRCTPVAVVTSTLSSSGNRLDTLEAFSADAVEQQFESVLSACRPAAARIGIVRGPRQVRRVGEVLEAGGVGNVVLAPVPKVAGTEILDRDSREAMQEALFPRARVLVVRAGDLQSLAGISPGGIEETKEAAAKLREQGAPAVLVAGVFSRGRVLDLLDDEGSVSIHDAPRLSVPRIGGLSAAHASALAAELARGAGLEHAAAAAQRYVVLRLQNAR